MGKARVLLLISWLQLVTPGASAAWTRDCGTSGCKVYQLTEVQLAGESEPVKAMLEVRASGEVFMVPMNTRRYHQRFWTTNPQTYLRLGETEYVPSRFFFNERFGGGIIVDGEVVANLDRESTERLRAKPEHFLRIVEAFKEGRRAQVTFTHYSRGSGHSVFFPLVGFTRAWSSVEQQLQSPSPSGPAVKPAEAILRQLNRAKFALTESDLQVRENPHGAGVFVFVPKRNYGHVPRFFFWFVKDSEVVNLNGATRSATPDAPYPRDTPDDFWLDTGVSKDDVIEVGRDAVRK